MYIYYDKIISYQVWIQIGLIIPLNQIVGYLLSAVLLILATSVCASQAFVWRPPNHLSTLFSFVSLFCAGSCNVCVISTIIYLSQLCFFRFLVVTAQFYHKILIASFLCVFLRASVWLGKSGRSSLWSLLHRVSLDSFYCCCCCCCCCFTSLSPQSVMLV